MTRTDARNRELSSGDGRASYDPLMPDTTSAPKLSKPPTAASPDAATAYSAEPLDYDDPTSTPPSLIASRSWRVASGIAALLISLGALTAVLAWLVGQPAAAPPTVRTSASIEFRHSNDRGGHGR